MITTLLSKLLGFWGCLPTNNVNVDVGSDDENVQVPPNMGKVKRPMHGEKGKEKKPKKGDKMSDMTLAICENTEILRQKV